MSDSIMAGISAELIGRISKLHTSTLGHVARIMDEDPSNEVAIANLKDFTWRMVQSAIFRQTDNPRDIRMRLTWFLPEVGPQVEPRYTLGEINRAVFDVTGCGVTALAKINAQLNGDAP